MTPAPTLHPPSTTPLIVPLEPLTPVGFSPFGTVITSPLPAHLNSVPASIPSPRHPVQQPRPIFANQNSAIKTSPISPLTNNYPDDDKDRPRSRPQMSMFSCFPRATLRPTEPKFRVKILERHPYTTQTFSPLGLSLSDQSTCFLVIVAPTITTATTVPPHSTQARQASRSSSADDIVKEIRHPPDLSQIKAFVARGDQAVTYGPGTWHAPMVVLGSSRVDFVVTQFVNGVADDDCQEVLVGGDVSVDLSTLHLRVSGSAKL